ncbi:hypothetical protein M430DRAFT_25396 [Amorphotheca resinae ATCC 22711]|uniref:Histone deacetylase complex subunit SAP30 Sin3 binding domain-containing protein n=1 Tax=Amorphotheca resinae ATCC 22711 TaxID=857342 RepID=A0A2T3BBE1_AMORE|nr:hypothetical protein M430DRAFT_25396 [Amorphotheca resinae ATCC 22711]PSS25618.1 hypothetical protein M430DRAFT_25396 [Amorphotheca resinae ATCC 22711]
MRVSHPELEVVPSLTREDGTLSYQFLLPASKKCDRPQLPVQRSHRIMAPSRPRPQQDDSRSEASSTKEKIGTSSSSAGNGKGRRPGNTAPASSLRDVVTAGPSNTAAGASATANSEPNPGIQWSSFDPSVLHGYRYDYRLNTPAAFNKQYNQMVLTNSPIGRMSPTMARHKQQRRQGKDQLANAVRKHFNSMGIIENEVVVDFLYKVRWQDKNFRMRFTPQRPR